MVIKLCPRCRTRISVFDWDVDYVHACTDAYGVGSAQVNEDVLVLGTWTDYTGSGESAFSKNTTLMQGMGTKNWGTVAAIEGANIDAVSARGANAETHRSRQHLEYINLREDE